MFWDYFERICTENKTSPNAVTKALGLSNATATKWKNGSVPNGKTLEKIACYFGVSVGYLLGQGEKTSPEAKSQGVRIPVYGKVAAGIPIEAITDIEDYEEITSDMASLGEYVALKIKGDSMSPRMTEGDVVIVRLQDDVESGDTAIVFVNGYEATCKKIKKTPEGVALISINPTYAPKFYTNHEIATLPIRIFGKVVELRAKF